LHDKNKQFKEKELNEMAKNGAQKGKPTADTVKQTIAKEELEKAIHPTKRQNTPQ
jgi:hypothetical protein